MRSGVRWLGFGVVALGAAAAVAARWASARWTRHTIELTDRIVRAAGASAAGGEPTVDLSAIEAVPSLPEPVRRYFRTALRDGQPRIRVARIRWAGTFRQVEPGRSPGPEEGWIPFTAVQTFTVDPPGFVWDASMRMLPFVDVLVRDAYHGGRGSMRAAALGLVTVADEHDKPHLDSGALLRYLAEAVWLPTALLPRPRLTWAPFDDRHARATLGDGETEVSARFEFGSAGDIVSVSADRQMSTGSGFILAPWTGRFWQHEVRDGMRIPVRGEVAWTLDGEERTYWRGGVVDIDYEFMPQAGDAP